jgi:ribosomal protein S18 acetylase RimI-like enzyme
MFVRKARIEDASAIVECLLLAMEDIVYEFIGEKNQVKAEVFMFQFVEQKNNQYSFQNCWVIEENKEILGAIVMYDGANLHELRTPIKEYISEVYSREFNPEEETQEGEFYIDSLGVKVNQQGNGVGSKLLQFLIDEYVVKRKQKLGLLVDKENPDFG